MYSFVYRGVLANESIRLSMPSAPEEQKEPEEDIRRRLPLDLLDDIIVINARRMSWVYTAIAGFENSVRAFIEERLLERVGANWWIEAVSADVRRKADQRKSDEEQIRWHGSRGTSNLAYVELGDLASIIQNNHAQFRELVPTAEWAREIFRSLERSRNVVMHSGQLRIADVERVAMNIRDWVRQVGG